MKALQLLRMMSVTIAIGSFVVVSQARADTGASSYDGRWGITLDCPNDARGATGYTIQFLAEVKNGHLHGQNGTPETAGSLSLDGEISENGAGSFVVNGRTGQAYFSVGRIQPNTPYTYAVTALFHGSAGKGKRVGGRVCRFDFVKSEP